jgi:NhaP-type Na+/H+ or K+/H+ antiporter
MLGPPWGGVLMGILLGVMLLALRVPAVNLALLGSDVRGKEKALVHVALPRGMAAGVLATLPTARGVPGTAEFPVIVFTAVFVTILVFAVGFPLAKKRMTQASVRPQPSAELATESETVGTLDTVPAPPDLTPHDESDQKP